MSAEAVAHVLSLNVGDSTRKLVLVGLAAHAGVNGTGAAPGVDVLARYANCSRRTVQRHVKALTAHGYVREGDQALVAHLRRDRRPMVYDVMLSDAEVTPFVRPAAVTYIVRRQRWVKIGRTSGPVPARVQTLVGEGRVICPPQMDPSRPVSVLHVIPADVERELHERFAHHWVCGEWFKADDRLLAELAGIAGAT